MSSRLRTCFLCYLTAALGAGAARADMQLDAAVLKKVKTATVLLEVSLPDGSTVEGSGFFTDEPGVVLTNAHVLGMLDADSRPPLKVNVTIDSGEADSRALPGKLLGVDRGSDLAVLRVEGKDLPPALKVVPAKDLIETAEVFIFGFPLGKGLGKNITVSRSSVSSLRKEGGRLKQIQVNGGMHPGNSGGPVVTANGEVVGVAVSGITGTQLNFAIPGELVQAFLNGRIIELGADIAYKDGDKVKMAFRLAVVDPLGRLKDITVETWTGEAGTRHRPPSSTEPKPLAGDSARQVIKVKYDKEAVTKLELSLPLTEGPKQVYWMQPSFVNGQGEKFWYGAWAPNLGVPLERKEATLRYQPRLGRTQLTELTSNGTFGIRLRGQEHSFNLNSKSLLVERSAEKKAGDLVPFHYNFGRFEMSMKQDGKPLKADNDDKEDVQNLAKNWSADLEMEADGNYGRGKGDVTRVPRASRAFAVSISDQVLQGLELTAVPLPQGAIKPLQTWNVQRTLELGPAGLGVQALADMKYTYLGTRLMGKREIAFFGITGRVKGVRGAGLNVGGSVSGATQVALDTGEVLTALLNFKADADVEARGGVKAKLTGTLGLQLRRDIGVPAKPPVKP